MSLGNVPKPILGAGVAGVGGLSLAGVLLFWRDERTLLLVALLLVAILITVALVLAYMYMLRLRDRRNARMTEEGIRANAEANQAGLSANEASRANEFADKFKTGLAEFSRHKKSIYDLPWYAIIGEPASGKTKALQKSGLKFPSFMLEGGLPGTGGTINMDWFFTEQAIILDTAGRLTTERVEATSTGPWKQFLQLLKKNRPLCPLNGVIVVIPADKLGIEGEVKARVFEGGANVEKVMPIAEYIEYMGAKLGQRLEQIQRDLGVRLSVYVVITKCDKIYGFREFFEQFNSPAAQEQILGWSFDAKALDTPFNPTTLEEALKPLYDRLRRRRLGLLLDPINTTDPSASRLDQVDSLYDFPTALKAIEPRLRRYLELILPANSWSTKSPFFRGVYFTSSVQEGEAIDTAYRNLVGHAPPAGMAATVEKALFLPDLFSKKIIPEQGLVTNADNTRALRRKRRIVMTSAALVAIFVLLSLSIWGQYSLSSSIGGHAAVFRDAAERFCGDPLYPLVEIDAGGLFQGYNGATKIAVGDGDEIEASRALWQVWEKVEQPITVPLIFRFRTLSSDLFASRRQEAYTHLVELVAFNNLVETAAARLDTFKGESWPDDATETLAQLIRMEALVQSAKLTPEAVQKPVIDLDPMIRLVMTTPPASDGKRSRFVENKEALEVFNNDPGRKSSKPGAADSDLARALVFSRVFGGDKPNPWLKDTSEKCQPFVDRGVQLFLARWSQPASGQGKVGQLKQLKEQYDKMSESAKLFAKAEDDLRKLSERSRPRSSDDIKLLRNEYEDAFKTLRKSREEMQDADKEAERVWVSLAGQGRQRDASNLKTVLEAARKELVADRTKAFDRLLESKPLLAASANKSDEPSRIAKVFADLEARRDEGEKQLTKSLDSLGGDLLVSIDVRLKDPVSAFGQRFDVYEACQSALNAPARARQKLSELVKAIDEVAGPSKLPQNVRDFIESPGNKEYKEGLRKLYAHFDSVGRAAQLNELVRAFLEAIGRDEKKIGNAIAELATEETVIPRIPRSAGFTDGGKFDKPYDPKALANFLNALIQVQQRLSPPAAGAMTEGFAIPDADQLARQFKELQTAFARQYTPACIAYYQHVRESAGPGLPTTWDKLSEFTGGLNPNTIGSINRAQLELAETLLRAVKGLATLSTADAKSDESTRLANELEKELKILPDSKFRADCAVTINAWAGLNMSPAAARRQLADYKAMDFATEFLAAYRDDQEGGSLYWNRFVLGAMRLLAKACTDEANRAWNDLVTEARRPPVWYSQELEPAKNPQPLTMAEVRALRSKLEALEGAVTAASATKTPTRLGDGDRRLLPTKATEQLNVIFATNLRPGADDKKWLAKLKTWLDELVKPRTCRIEFEPIQGTVPVRGAEPNNDYFRYMEVRVEPVMAGDRRIVQMDKEAAFNAGRLTVEHGEAAVSVQLQFFGNAELGLPLGESDLWKSNWGMILPLMRTPGVRPPDSSVPAWRLPVVIREKEPNAGKLRQYDIRLRFTEEFASPRPWFVQTDYWPSN